MRVIHCATVQQAAAKSGRYTFWAETLEVATALMKLHHKGIEPHTVYVAPVFGRDGKKLLTAFYFECEKVKRWTKP